MRPLPRAESVLSNEARRAFVRATETAGLHGVMVAQGGEVVLEQWWAPYSPDLPQTVHSVSKTFLATAVGIARAEGHLDLDAPAAELLQYRVPSDRGREVTVRHLLTMSSGHEIDTMDAMLALRNDDWVRIFFEAPFPYPPGVHFQYNGGCSHLLAAILHKVTGAGLVDYLTPRLFEPLGIDRPRWAVNSAGVELGSSGLRARLEDLTKLGQLYLDGGRWGGRTIVPPAWVEESTRAHIDTDREAADWRQGYGFHVWRSTHGFRADGAHGQFVLVLPELDAVIAITAGTREPENILEAVWETLLPALDGGRVPVTSPLPLELAVPAFGDSPPESATFMDRTLAVSPNTYGINRVLLQHDGDTTTLQTFTEKGASTLRAGRSSWVHGVLDPWPYEPELRSSRTASRAGWTGSSTFEIHEQLLETALRRVWRFEAAGDAVWLDLGTDLRFWTDRQERLLCRPVESNE